jgi:hypothetical protein
MSEAGVYYPPETRVLPLTKIRRERMLPRPGKVLVNSGDRVQPAQPVAQTEVSGEVSVVNVAHLRALRLPAHKYIKSRKALTYDDTVIASGLTSAGRVKSPANGFCTASKVYRRVLIKWSAARSS